MLEKKKINDIVFITRIVIKILVVLKADMLTLFSMFPCDTRIFHLTLQF
jgi:hypothetical protein